MRIRKNLKYLLFFIFLWISYGPLSAQTPPKVRAYIEPDSVMIGDHFTVNVEVEKDLVQVIDFPHFEKGKIGDNIEILQEMPVDTINRDGRHLTIRKQYLLTTFDEGFYNLGRFPALYMDKNVTDTLFSPDSLFLTVTTFEIDTLTMQIYDIKDPIHTPVLAGEYLGYLISGLFIIQILAAIVFIIMKSSRKQKTTVPTKKQPTEPPHITAIRELEKLNSEKLWQNQRHKLYYTRLTDIVREYMEARYHINAMEMTSDEITEALQEVQIPERSYEKIRRLLSTADYVKFAKYVPNLGDNEMSYNDAYYFVEETKYIAVDPTGKEDETP